MSIYIPPPPARNERELQRQIVDYLRWHVIEPLWHRTDKRTTGTVGWPDITFAVSGIACCWEIKFGNGKLSPEQADLAELLMSDSNNWRWDVIKSLEEAKEEFARIANIAIRKIFDE